jgi:hypothetical protein
VFESDEALSIPLAPLFDNPGETKMYMSGENLLVTLLVGSLQDGWRPKSYRERASGSPAI